MELPIKVKLHLLLYEQDGQERFHVHAVVDGQPEPVDVTDQYELIAAQNPETGQRGFTLLKKQPTPIEQETSP